MKCPGCGGKAWITSPDYGYGHGTGYRCYNLSAHGGEYNFSSRTPGVNAEEAARESAASLAQSKANAAAYRRNEE